MGDLAIAQLFWIIAILTVYVVFGTIFRPWRQIILTVVDVWAHQVLILVTASLCWFARKGLNDDDIAEVDDNMSYFAAAITSLILPMGILSVASVTRTASDRPVQLRADQARIQAAMKVGASMSDQAFAEFLAQLGEWDIWFLRQAAWVIFTEVTTTKCRPGVSTRKLTIDSFDSSTIQAAKVASVEDAMPVEDNFAADFAADAEVPLGPVAQSGARTGWSRQPPRGLLV